MVKNSAVTNRKTMKRTCGRRCRE